MRIYSDLADAIGKTPLIRLRKASAATGCEILGKAEFLNPGQSVKDRAALHLVECAEARGALRPGGTVVEGTAGNTGIGLAHICAARGCRLIIYMPDTQSSEKMDLLRMLGAARWPAPGCRWRNMPRRWSRRPWSAPGALKRRRSRRCSRCCCPASSWPAPMPPMRWRWR